LRPVLPISDTSRHGERQYPKALSSLPILRARGTWPEGASRDNCGYNGAIMKIRVFELAKAKNMTISQVVDMLREKGIKDASAITFVDPNIFGAIPVQPLPQPTASDRPAAVARNIVSRESSDKRRWTREEPRQTENPLVYLSLGLSVVSFIAVLFLIFSARSDHADLKDLEAQINLVKASNGKVEDMVISNRAQILDTRDQITGIEKRFYEFKKNTAVSLLKGEGGVLKALSEGMKEPLKSKTQALANGLSTF
jgi:hypothetical protein